MSTKFDEKPKCPKCGYTYFEWKAGINEYIMYLKCDRCTYKFQMKSKDHPTQNKDD